MCIMQCITNNKSVTLKKHIISKENIIINNKSKISR